jgi:phage/plasmid-like protein (TIGR03299 family)
MAHNIDTSNGRNNIAFLGSREDIWHRLGQEMRAGMSIDEWCVKAGLNWTAQNVPAFADTDRGPVKAEGWRFIVRSDTNNVLGCVSDRYKVVQPRDVLDWFEEYISADSRFALDVAGSLKHGQIIWATATYREPIEVAGNQHVPRLLMTTSFDTSMPTINRATMTRVVCNNTLDCATHLVGGTSLEPLTGSCVPARRDTKKLFNYFNGLARRIA